MVDKLDHLRCAISTVFTGFGQLMVMYPIQDCWYKVDVYKNKLVIWEIHLLCCLHILLSCLLSFCWQNGCTS